MNRNKWTEEDIATLDRMLAQGYCNAEIAPKVGRSKYAVQTYRRDRARTDEDKAAKRRRANELARLRNDKPKTGRLAFGERIIDRPTPDILRERDRRLALPPRDLTAAFCGDPLPGYSALERRA